MDTKELKVEYRTLTKKNEVKKLRANNLIPGIIYGNSIESENITVDYQTYERMLKNPLGRNIVLELKYIKNDKDVIEKVISYEITKDAITGRIIHIDFLRVQENKPVSIPVWINFTGVAPGTKMGGTLIKKLDQLKIKVLPNKIPQHITVDLSSLQVGEFLRVSDLSSSDYEILTNGYDSIARVSAPRGKDVSENTDELTEEATDIAS